MTDAWAGVDLGTQSVRAIVLDELGEVVGSAAAPLTSVREGGRHEQDPGQWWTATRAVLRRATAGLPAGTTIRALAVSGTSGTLVPVDPAGRPAGAAVMYDDRRGAGALPAVQEAGSAVWSRLGYRVQATWALPKLVTLVREGALGPGVRVAHQPDVVAARLAGRPVPSDLSSALKTGADLDAIAWPTEVLAALGVPSEVLPGLAESGSVLGEVSAAAAGETGLPAGCAIVAGTTDGCAAQLSAGAVRPGEWNSVLGTTLVVKGVADERRTDPSGVVYAHRAPFDGGWYPGGASSTGAGAVSAWLPGRDLDALTRRAASLPGVPVAYPLVGTGERFPFVADDAVALAPGTVPIPELPDEEALAAIVWGTAFVERLAYERLAAAGYPVGDEVLVTGGGSRNPWWTAVRAEVQQRTLLRPFHAEGAAGMALLACAAGRGGEAPLLEAAAALLPAAEGVEPAPRRAEVEDAYAAFVLRLAERGWLGEEAA